MAATSGALQSRLSKELKQLSTDPPPGVWCSLRGDSLTSLDAQIEGPADTVYAGGVFKLSVDVPARYPFEPPKVKFITPVYHPNIDPEGRICLDILNMPPKGGWKPSLNLATVLQSVALLLAHPNPDDGLVTDITAEYKHQRQAFDARAREWTRRHAIADAEVGLAAGAADAVQAAAAEPRRKQQQQQEHEQQGDKENGGGAVNHTALADAGQQRDAAEKPAAEPAEGAEQPAKRSRLALRK